MNHHSIKDRATFQDKKLRWGGLLENPHISKFQRDCLDYGRVQGLGQALAGYSFDTLLEVGCGFGECSAAKKARYYGLDNSIKKISFAQKKYPEHRFIYGDALHLPFRNNSLDAVTMVDTSHHLSDQELKEALKELMRVSRGLIVLSDPILTDGQSRLSSFFYRLDRGACFRHVSQMKDFFQTVAGLQLLKVVEFKTFPGIYVHAAFILQKNLGEKINVSGQIADFT